MEDEKMDSDVRAHYREMVELGAKDVGEGRTLKRGSRASWQVAPQITLNGVWSSWRLGIVRPLSTHQVSL